MVDVLNVVFGIGIGVVIFVLVLLGIQAFYPEVRYEEFCNQTMYGQTSYGYEKCPDNITVGECRTSMAAEDKKMEKCSQDYMNLDKIYSKNFFIIASILGVIVVLVAFFLPSMINIRAGLMCSGIVTILWAFIRGWQGTDDKLKFIVGLVIAAIIITLAVIMNNRLAKQKA